jgi:phosphatidylserine decarboxylase
MTRKSVTYKPGAFLLAFTPKSSELNERNDIVIRNGTRKLVVRQIAGTIARKIVWWAKPGMRVQRGDKYGMIRFGSRIDLLLPQNVTIKIKVGQRVVGGTTMIGLWSSI